MNRAATSFILIVLSCSSLLAQNGNCDQGSATTTLMSNDVILDLNNRGWPIQSRHAVPKTSEANALSGFGFWLSGKYQDQYRSAISTSSASEWWPGPAANIVGGENCSNFDRIFRISRSDLNQLVNEQDTSTAIRDWPWQFGAPVFDGDGVIDNYNLAGGDLPLVRGDEMAWWIMNDLGNSHDLSQSQSLGVEVRVSAISIKSFDALDRSTFLEFEMTNKNDVQLDSLFVGFQMDAALGNPYDNYFGTDPERGLSFFYNADNEDESYQSDNEDWTGYDTSPPAFGFLALEGPRADDDGRDNNDNGVIDEEGEMLIAYRSFGSPFTDTNCDDGSCFSSPRSAHFHLTGKNSDGLLYQDACLMWGGRCHQSDFYWSFPGNPPEFWSEMNIDDMGTPNVAGLRSSMNVFGQFTLLPEESKKVVVALVWARGSDHLDSISELRESAGYILGGYRAGLILDPVFPTSESLESPTLPLEPLAFPNPSTGIFRLNKLSGDSEIKIFDSQGRLIQRKRLAGFNAVDIDISEQPQGLYFLQVENEKILSYRKLIKL